MTITEIIKNLMIEHNGSLHGDCFIHGGRAWDVEFPSLTDAVDFMRNCPEWLSPIIREAKTLTDPAVVECVMYF